MTRQDMITRLAAGHNWDICIIGGGATGLGIAVDAASRGYKTILLEQYDFAKGTSSRATKLVHGGVRYLQQGNIKLVTEALRERGILRRNAPHLVKDLAFIIPNHKWWEGPYYWLGLKAYDWLAGSLSLGKSRLLSRKATLQLAPTLDARGLRGGILYHDGQFDDARLAINLAQTAAAHNAVVINYCRVHGFLKKQGRIEGVAATDTISGQSYNIPARVVINATGVFTDNILHIDDPASEPIITPSQGVHIMLDKTFLPGNTAILVPRTEDGRVLFAVPWHDRTIVGTTDTLVDHISIEPRALPEEIDFILRQIGHYLQKDPGYGDILSVFAGLRPLVKNTGRKTAEISREHLILVSDSGLITITGGKWTTYRLMAKDTVDTAISRGGLPDIPCITAALPILGAGDRDSITSLAAANPQWGEKLHPRLPYILADIVHAARAELCMTVEDALSRRTRSLLLDAQAAIDCAAPVAAILAAELGKDRAWQHQQVQEFEQLAAGYLVHLPNAKS